MKSSFCKILVHHEDKDIFMRITAVKNENVDD